MFTPRFGSASQKKIKGKTESESDPIPFPEFYEKVTVKVTVGSEGLHGQLSRAVNQNVFFAGERAQSSVTQSMIGNGIRFVLKELET